MMKKGTAIKLSAIAGALGVGLGAFGAHGLEEMLVRSGRLDTWKTAVFYHLVHAVILLVLALHGRWKPLPWILFAIGITVFSGSLYILCLTGIGWLGAITPVGGVFLIAGWVALIPSHKEH